MAEGIVISLLFIGAIVYLLRLVRQNFKAKEEGCAKGCGTCASASAKPATKAGSPHLTEYRMQ